MKTRSLIWTGAALLLILMVAAWVCLRQQPESPPAFNAQRAYADVQLQESFGPRLPGSPAHTRAVDWMVTELTRSGWLVRVQETTRMGHPIRNVIAERGSGKEWVVLGAHFDSRQVADNDPDPSLRQLPVPGANDGASGVAVLLELARVLPVDLDKTAWLVFFDAEDQGNLPGWDWIEGSRAFVEQLQGMPDAVVVIDMIGDANLDIYRELNSDSKLTDSIWDTAHQAGFADHFLPAARYRITDDHVPFLERGIRAVDIIDFNYAYWHTSADTSDKVSPESLRIVGEVLVRWLAQPLPPP